MTKWKYRLAIAALWLFFVVFVAAIATVLAFITVIPMIENLEDHGTVFIGGSQP